jgi:5-methylcytosine-specific restriction endonuclease McrBC GTP-binding regulatory subunit McrB
MLNFFRGILCMEHPSIDLKKSSSGDWKVMRQEKILYIGTKENCRNYMRQFGKSLNYQ